jgi:hypothetical protein
VIGVSLPTVQRDLRLAKAWLRRMLMDKTNNEV